MIACASSPFAELRQQVLELLCPHYLAQVDQELGLEWRQTPLALPNLVALLRRARPRGASGQPIDRPEWMSPRQFAALPASIVVRVLCRRVKLPGSKRQLLTLVTTLLDPLLYPAGALLGLLKGRWAVASNLRHLKATMKLEILRSTTPEGIEKELRMFLILYNAVRVVILEAAAKQEVPVGRISFADALYWVRHGDLAQPLPKLQVVPCRPDCVEPRVVKRRPQSYPWLNKPREQMRKPVRARRDGGALVPLGVCRHSI
jgi:hypothetical protein